jgi:hypothetical protein
MLIILINENGANFAPFIKRCVHIYRSYYIVGKEIFRC